MCSFHLMTATSQREMGVEGDGGGKAEGKGSAEGCKVRVTKTRNIAGRIKREG